MSKSLVFKGNEITPFDNGDNKIWFTSSQMAKLLEYKNEKSVTNLYNANKDEFSDDMTMVTETMTNGINNNLRKKKVSIFSVRGAHLIGMLANTDVAKALRRWLLDLAEKESKPQTGAVRPLVEAGTHRNDSGDSLNVAGIHLLQGVEDVK